MLINNVLYLNLYLAKVIYLSLIPTIRYLFLDCLTFMRLILHKKEGVSNLRSYQELTGVRLALLARS